MPTLKVIFFLLPEIVKMIRNLSAFSEEIALHIKIRSKLNAINNAFKESNAKDRAAYLDAVFSGKLPGSRDQV